MSDFKFYEYLDIPMPDGKPLCLRVGNENCYSLSGVANPSHLHLHSFAELLLVTNGNARCFYNNVSKTVKKGELLVFDEGTNHLITDYADFACYSLGIEGVSFNADEKTFVVDLHTEFDFCQSAFKKILEEAKSKRKNHQEIVLNLLKAVSFSLSRISLFNKTTAASPAVQPAQLNIGVYAAKNFIESYYNSNILLSTLCQIAYLSPQHLIRQFKQLTGFTPKQYLNMVRIQVASYAILDTFENIKTIAKNVGYDDYQAFLYTFKTVVGITPQQFRNVYKSKPDEGRKLTAFIVETKDGIK